MKWQRYWLLSFALLLLPACSVLDKAIDNVGTALQGSGGAGAGAIAGCQVAGPMGCVAGAMLGGATGAVVADKTIDAEPPTIMDLLEQIIEITGWAVLGIFVLPWVIGLFHDKPKLRGKKDPQ